MSRNAMITGANRGIGRATVQLFAENGYNIWACARTQTPEFEADMAALAEANGVTIKPVYFDLANEEQIKAAFKEVYKEKQPIDVLVNAAGVVNTDLFYMTPMNRIRETFEANFFGPVCLTQLVLKLMQRQKQGSIVNISSIAGQDANPTNVTYGSSKAAISAFTRILASETGQTGIRVNAVAPGPTDTDMVVKVKEKVGEAILERCAMNRMAQPEEVAKVILFLASEESSFINGQVIRVDGGAR